MESMNAQSSMTHNARTMQTKRIKWKDINWIIAESYVNRLQVRIVKAVQKGRWRLVKRLQKLITNSFYAKAIAVKRDDNKQREIHTWNRQSGVGD